MRLDNIQPLRPNHAFETILVAFPLYCQKQSLYLPPVQDIGPFLSGIELSCPLDARLSRSLAVGHRLHPHSQPDPLPVSLPLYLWIQAICSFCSVFEDQGYIPASLTKKIA